MLKSKIKTILIKDLHLIMIYQFKKKFRKKILTLKIVLMSLNKMENIV